MRDPSQDSPRVQDSPGRMAPVLSVSTVVLNHNRAESLLRCLGSVFALDPAPSQVIVVDNASSDDSRAKAVALYGDRLTWISREENSVTAARNQGFRAARGDWILSLDNDTILPKTETLALGAQIFNRFPRAGLLAFRITSPDSPDHHQAEHWWHPFEREKNEDRRFWTSFFPEAAILVRREALEAVGGYDEDFMMGGEQLDLALSLLREGHGLLYCPDLVAIEEDVRGELQTVHHPIHILNLRNRLWTAWKHLPCWTALGLGAAWSAGALFRALRFGHLRYWWQGFSAGLFAPARIRSKRNPLPRSAVREFQALRKGLSVDPECGETGLRGNLQTPPKGFGK